jgi:hypothetical protein
MDKRSHRRIRDLVAHTAFQGLDANEIGCARISMMAGSKTLPSKGRIQMCETNYLQINIPACNARPVHTEVPCVDGSELARAFFTCAALVGAAMCSAFERGSYDRWP